MSNIHRFPYEWRLSDGYPAKSIENHQSTVFGTFICGGGSTMGYKLAGYHHLGGVEIDPKVADVYKRNHSPEYMYVEDVRHFLNREDLPDELYRLDLFDTSPPCTSFSIAGVREKAWGKKKHFKEGQQLQMLDDLVFVACDVIRKLHPKTFLLENVSGLIKGNAKSYAKRILDRLMKYGYAVQVFCLNAASMGVPQTRERVFFIGHKKEYHLPKLVLDFHEPPILFGDIIENGMTDCNVSDKVKELWGKRIKTDFNLADILQRTENRCSRFNERIIHSDRVAPTFTSQMCNHGILYDYPRKLNIGEQKKICTFPLDYKVGDREFGFFGGMSVPPVMTAQISYEIWKQWIKPIKENYINKQR